MESNFSRAARELAYYAAERQIGFERHQGSQIWQPGERNEWIRGILRGMAEMSGADPGEFTGILDYCLETARGAFAVEPVTWSVQRHMIQSLCQYVDRLERLDGDQRARVKDVARLLDDISACLSWDASRIGVYPARDQAEAQLLRITVRRPIRFTRVLIGGDFDPGGVEFMPGLVNDAKGVRGAPLFQQVIQEYPERKEWPAICTVCLGSGGRLDNGVIDADELDMAVIREAGDRILKQPEISLVPPRQLRVPVMDKPVKTPRQKGMER